MLARTNEATANDSIDGLSWTSVAGAVGELHRVCPRTEPDIRRPDVRAMCTSRLVMSESSAIRHALAQAEQVAPTPATVLLLGETGVGKELFAQAIHEMSPQAHRPMIRVSCAAIPSTLIESELFGHERGAFTGAVMRRIGRFEAANQSTLFLDEIGELSLDIQVKLLRVLQERVIERLGSTQPIKVDVRIIGATHVDLPAAVARGEFREDLFYRLNVVALLLPPLRAREGDVELLAETFITRLAAQYGLPPALLDLETRSRLRAHPWPGNVRELRNVIERALVLSTPGRLELEDLGASRVIPESGGELPFPAPLRTITQAAVERMLRLAHGNKSEAARRLGISRPRLQRIIDGLGEDE